MSLAKSHLNPERDVNNDIAGIKIPDSKMARDLTQLIRDTARGPSPHGSRFEFARCLGHIPHLASNSGGGSEWRCHELWSYRVLDAPHEDTIDVRHGGFVDAPSHHV